MPFVHVELVEGRSPEQLENMMKDITEAVHKNTQAPKEHIHVIINEMKKGTYGVNGVSCSAHFFFFIKKFLGTIKHECK
ncbi:hypothetical protein EfmJHP38_12810 [Enterococcus faecium]|nr:hypothetical protein EfmJHP38_12810 [Enterococcus faecium]